MSSILSVVAVALIIAVSIIGTIPGWLTVAAVVVLGYLMTRGQLGPALGYLREANVTLVQQNQALHDKARELEREIVVLRARTDLAPVQALLVEQMKGHEDRAQGRYEATLNILKLLADRLGPDANGLSGRAKGGA